MSFKKGLAIAFKDRSCNWEFWLHVTPIALLLFSLGPVTFWTVRNANEQSRLFHAIIVLVTAIAALIRFDDVKTVRLLELNAASKKALVIAYALLALQWILRGIVPEDILPILNLISISAHCCAIA